MPVIVDTFVNEAGETVNVYESGAHYNVTKKHLVKAPDHAVITPEKSRKYKEQLAEKKREAMVRGAGRALEKAQAGEWSVPNALDVVEALGEAAMMKALNPDNAKQIDAARFIMQEAGMAESQTKTSDDAQQSGPVSDLTALVRELRLALQARPGLPADPVDVIDGDATDIRNDLP